MNTDTNPARRSRRRLLVALVLLAGAGTVVYFGLVRTRPGATVVFQVHYSRTMLSIPPEAEQALFQPHFDAESARLRHPSLLAAALQRPGVSDLGVVRAQPDPVAWLTDNLRVEGGPGLMRVELFGENEDELVAVLDALAAAYLADVDERDNGPRRRRLAATEERRRAARAEAERVLMRINQLARLVPNEPRLPDVDVRNWLTEELREARLEMSELEWRIADPAADPPDALPDLGLLARREQLARRKVAELEEKIRWLDEFRTELDRLRRTVTGADATEKHLAEEIARLKVDLGVPARVEVLDEPRPRRGR